MDENKNGSVSESTVAVVTEEHEKKHIIGDDENMHLHSTKEAAEDISKKVDVVDDKETAASFFTVRIKEPVLDFLHTLRMFFPESEPHYKEAKYTRAELKERFRKRLEHMSPAEQRKLKIQRALGWAWPIFRAMIIIGLCFIILYPLIFMVSTAFRTRADMSDPTVLWIPRNLTLSNLKDAMLTMDYWPTFRNTLIINIGCSIIQVFSCALTGYGFARFKFKGQSILFFIVVLQILIPPQIINIPQFKFFRYFDPFGLLTAMGGEAINFIDNPITMYLPAILGNGIRAGLFIFLFRQSFRGLPKELEDAAYLDGCSPFKTFLMVMAPNAASTFLTVFLFSIVWYWNDYYVTSTFFTSFGIIALKLKNLDAAIAKTIFGNTTVPVRDLVVWLEAGCLAGITPILILYIALQKYFTEGISRSGLTGM
ncbi:MAG: carbohydrate ABC transporter permease [Ruminococcus sp.]|jgi:multiple sugar transport system permease protein|nr:carbohydrate ABC transporter permease [Ruminococcus sp.]